jgi:hypothetical protein
VKQELQRLAVDALGVADLEELAYNPATETGENIKVTITPVSSTPAAAGGVAEMVATPDPEIVDVRAVLTLLIMLVLGVLLMLVISLGRP